MDRARFPAIIRSMYALVDELEAMFPGRRFTPDGHMVGSIGEALASHFYGLQLYAASAEGHDGEVGGLQVQVKATQGKSVALRSKPDHLLVLKLGRDGSFVEVYNGPGEPVWALVSTKPLPRNGQRQVRLASLSALMSTQRSDARVPRLVD